MEDDSFGKMLSGRASSFSGAKSSSPKTKKYALDLSPENFFMTSTEMNGKCRLPCPSPFMYIKKSVKLTKLVKAQTRSSLGIGTSSQTQKAKSFPNGNSFGDCLTFCLASQSEFLLGDVDLYSSKLVRKNVRLAGTRKLQFSKFVVHYESWILVALHISFVSNRNHHVAP